MGPVIEYLTYPNTDYKNTSINELDNVNICIKTRS